MSDWSRSLVGDFFDLEGGFAFKSADFAPEGIPVIKIKNVKAGYFSEHDFSYVSSSFLNERANKIARWDDLLISMSGNRHDGSPETWVGKVALFRKTSKFLINQRVGVLRLKPGVKFDVRFASYLLSSFPYQELFISIATSSGGQANLSPAQILKAPLKYPDISTQQAIGEILGSLDDKIDLNRRMNETLEQTARLLFKDWFVDFGPTRAKLAGQEAYLESELWDLFPERLDEAGVPEGWRIGELQEIVTLNPSEKLTKGKPAVYLDMAALPTSGSIADAPIMRDFTSGSKFRNGDTLFARITPCLENGKTAFVQTLPEASIGWGSTEFIVLRSRYPVPPAYTYLLARDEAFRAHAVQSMTGTSGRQRVRNEALAPYPSAIPTTAVWQAFAKIVNPLFLGIKATGEESRTLAQTRNLLLPKLMSGELSVRDAEAYVAEVV